MYPSLCNLQALHVKKKKIKPLKVSGNIFFLQVTSFTSPAVPFATQTSAGLRGQAASGERAVNSAKSGHEHRGRRDHQCLPATPHSFAAVAF